MPEKTDAENQSSDSSDSPVDPLVKAYIDAEIEKTYEHEDTPRKKKWKNSWRAASPITKGTFLITCAIGAATICYAFIAAFQLCAMKGQLAQMKADSENSGKQFQAQLGHFDDGLGRTGLLAQHAGEQAAASQTLADTAPKSLQAAIDNFHRDQRAWVGAVNVVGPVAKGQPLDITIQIQNSGKTPAVDMLPWQHGELLSAIPNVFQGCKENTQRAESRAIINPGQPFYMNLHPTHGKPLEIDIPENQDIYAYGCVVYKDVFRQLHWMTFCFSWDEKGKGYDPCNQYNETGDGSLPSK